MNPVRTRLATLSGEIDDQQVEGDRATLAVQRVPEMLGATRKRVYFIAFTTPSESRGLGGFMGNWAEVTIDKGHISVTNFGRTADLAVNGDTEHWVRITSSPHFPEVAQAIADGYPAFSGHPVDGVFAMDVYTVAALMKLTGPIDLTDDRPDGVGRQRGEVLAQRAILGRAGPRRTHRSAGGSGTHHDRSVADVVAAGATRPDQAAQPVLRPRSPRRLVVAPRGGGPVRANEDVGRAAGLEWRRRSRAS